METRRVKLSEMKPGDTGYLPSEGAFVELRAGDDLYLALIIDELEPVETYPTIIVDTDAVGVWSAPGAP